jgi:hypothetical protein
MVKGEIREIGTPIVFLAFVIPGNKTSLNPISAFIQGLNDESSDQVYRYSNFLGYLCKGCGYFEMTLNHI